MSNAPDLNATSPKSQDTLHFNLALTVMRQERAHPHLQHATVKPHTLRLCHTAPFKLQIYSQHQQMAKKSSTNLMFCLVFIMRADIKPHMINALNGEKSLLKKENINSKQIYVLSCKHDEWITG